MTVGGEGMRLEVRRAVAGDAGAIAALVNAAYRPGKDNAGWTHESGLVSGERTSVAQVESLMARPDSMVLVGTVGDALVGCIHLEREGGACYIGMLAVSPALQGAGFGKQLVAAAESHAIEVFSSVCFRMVVLSAREELIGFYLRRGYRRTGEVMDYPIEAGVGMPLYSDLSIEVLEKRAG